MKKVIYATGVFLVICLVSAISVEAANSGPKSLYINNVNIPTGNGYVTSSLQKTEKGFQYIISKSSQTFRVYVYGPDSNGYAAENPTRYNISGYENGLIQDVSSQYNFGYGIGQTHLRLVSAGLFGRNFQGAWIPDKSFYDYVIQNGGI